jgi:CheY-like chemotaxis protein/HPt (histidine-containing phosphotransfer) domain-containing protein
LLRTMLARLDYAVSCAPTGRDAISMMSHARFQLALIALRLPDMAGLALAKRVAGGRQGWSGVPVLMFGDSFDHESMLAQCHEAGVEGYLQKPLSFTRLVAAVHELTRRHARPWAEGRSMTTSLPIELDRLRQFTDGDTAVEEELGRLFLASAGSYLNEMTRALQQAREWRSMAHALKGASANIGATAMAELAARAESGPPSPETLDALGDALEQVRRFFDRLQPPQGPGDLAAVGSTQQLMQERNARAERA